jgi:Tol biopolymer transport system component
MPSADVDNSVTWLGLRRVCNCILVLSLASRTLPCFAQSDSSNASSQPVFRVVYQREGRIPLAMDAPTFRNIFAANTNGGGEENLTGDNHSLAPVFSPDGSRIAYLHMKSETCEDCLLHAEYELYVMNADGTNPQFVNDLQGPFSPIRWSPDSKGISYGGWSKRDSQSSVRSGPPLFLSKVDSTASPLVLTQEAVGDFEWSPDGRWIAHGCITQHAAPQARVGRCLTKVGEPGNPTVLSTGPLSVGYSWSPDSVHVAFVAGDWKTHSIAVAGTDGSQPKVLTSIHSIITRPQWSPDGTQIVFLDSDHGKSAIFRMNADGSNRLRLTEPKLKASNPIWSPDGKQIAFSAVVHDWLQVYVMSADGSVLRQVTRDKKMGCSAHAWLPNTTLLLLVCGSVRPPVDPAPRVQHWNLSLLDLEDPVGVPRQLAKDIQGPFSFTPIPRSQVPSNP